MQIVFKNGITDRQRQPWLSRPQIQQGLAQTRRFRQCRIHCGNTVIGADRSFHISRSFVALGDKKVKRIRFNGCGIECVGPLELTGGAQVILLLEKMTGESQCLCGFVLRGSRPGSYTDRYPYSRYEKGKVDRVAHI